MRARFSRQFLYRIEINHHKFCEFRQRKRIEWLIAGNAREITQAQRAQLKLFSLFRGRQKKILHRSILTLCSPCLRGDALCFVTTHDGDTEDAEISLVFVPAFG